MNCCGLEQSTMDLLWRAAKISLVVGSVLNLVNQGDVLWGDTELEIWHFLLNYLVPFGVSSFSAMQARDSQPLSLEVRTLDDRPATNATCRARRRAG